MTNKSDDTNNYDNFLAGLIWHIGIGIRKDMRETHWIPFQIHGGFFYKIEALKRVDNQQIVLLV